MKTVEVGASIQAEDLRRRIDELLRLIEEEGEAAEVTNRGKIIARVVPTDKPHRPDKQELERLFADVDRLADEISAHWQGNMDAVEAVRDVRQEL